MVWTCRQCKEPNEVESTERKILDKLYTVIGFTCQKCNTFNKIYVTTRSLDEAMQELERLNQSRQDFQYHFAKVLKKAIGVQEKYNGAF